MAKHLIVIPARYASTRFPGKPLAKIGEKPMVQWVYENASKTGFDTVVATDDDRILKAVEAFGGKAVLTNPDHPSGTDRCLEAAEEMANEKGNAYDIIINVQGDEPFIDLEQIQQLASCFENENVDIATLVTPIPETEDYTFLADPNKVKAVVSENGLANYFSRSPIPYLRNVDKENWLKEHKFFLHLGMYAYRFNVLHEITKLSPSTLEKVESLEQLRWLENGYKIMVKETNHRSIGVDTPEDLESANLLIKK